MNTILYFAQTLTYSVHLNDHPPKSPVQRVLNNVIHQFAEWVNLK